MSDFDRAAHCRRIAHLGGEATVRLHGRSHMAAIGKRGFATAIALGWGPQLAAILGPSYRAKYHREIKLGRQARAKAKIRREARAIWSGMPCDVASCDARGQVHHRFGLDVARPNDRTNILILCPAHHVELHRELRRARRKRRPALAPSRAAS